MLANLRSIAPKQDEVRVPEVWSSCMHGTLSNLPPKLLKRKRCMHRNRTFRSGRFVHGTFRSVYEILQKSYINANSSRLIQSALPPSSYSKLPKVEAFHSKRTPFTIRNSGKRCRQGILLGIKFLVVVQSNGISGVSGSARVVDYDS